MLPPATSTYFQTVQQQRVLVIGILPPPLGGMSVHIARSQQQLQLQQNQVRVLDVLQLRQTGIINYGRYLARLISTLWHWRPQTVHYHVLALWRWPIDLWILTLFKRWHKFNLVNIEHVGRYLQQRGWFYKQVVGWLLRSVNQQVLMGQPNAQHYRQAGWLLAKQEQVASQVPVSQYMPSVALFRIRLISRILLARRAKWGRMMRKKSVTITTPFLPPDITRESQILAQYPATLFTFLAQQQPVILVNASRISFWQGIDVYGLDQAIALLVQLYQQPGHQPVGLILAIAQLDQPAYLQQLIQQALRELNLSCPLSATCIWHQLALAPNLGVLLTPEIGSGQCCRLPVYLLTGNYELWPLLKRVQLFLRPTSTDNCAVSEAEAAYFGTPTVASDVCQRSANTILFKARDQHDLNQQVQQLLAKSRGTAKLQQVVIRNLVMKIQSP